MQKNLTNPRPIALALGGLLLLFGGLAVGSAAAPWLPVPLPAAVLGMTLVAVLLIAFRCTSSGPGRWLRAGLEAASRPLLSHLGLLFVPAGVGVITEAERLKAEWLPIGAALLLSTLAGLAASGYVMQRLARDAPSDKEPS